MITPFRDCAPSTKFIEEATPRIYGSAEEASEGVKNPTHTMHNIIGQIGFRRFILILLVLKGLI
jgi:hypothetical protein